MNTILVRNRLPKRTALKQAIQNPLLLIRELNKRSFYDFFKFMWPEYSDERLILNWHIEYLCNELQEAAERVAKGEPREDIIINIPPGSSKTAICSIMFPIWCWTRWHWMKFITVSYSAALALESAEYSRDLIRSDRFRAVYPELEIKEDKDTKSNFRVVKRICSTPGHVDKLLYGGNRFSTSIGGSLTGFHGHFIIWDDPLNPHQAVSETELSNVNRWMTQTLPTRKVNKKVTCTIGVMQRLHQNDPTGHILDKKKKNIKLICLPGEINTPQYRKLVNPPELIEKYVNGLLDVERLDEAVLKDLEADLGQYSYAGQIGQSPTPPTGGMFKVDKFVMIDFLPNLINFEYIIRYWDKAGTKEQADGKNKACYTVGCKMGKLKNGKWIVMDVVRGRWASEEREDIIKSTAEGDGTLCKIYYEQEPGSGGKESAEATTRNLAGFSGKADRPIGDKIFRADPYSVQVNNGNIQLLKGDWNHEFIEEHRNFPFSTYKDQVDASSGAFAKLTSKRRVKTH